MNPQNRKIAFVTPILAPFRVTFYEKLFQRLEFQCCLFHGIKKADDGRPSFAGEIKIPNISHFYREYKLGKFTIRGNFELIYSVIKYNPNIIILPGISGNISYQILSVYAKLFRKKLVIWTCSWESEDIKGFYRRIKNLFAVSFFKRANISIAYSSHAFKHLANLGFPSDNITICYNGLEIDPLINNESLIKADGQQWRSEAGFTDNDFVFLYVGGISTDKKIPLLIEAFQLLQKETNNIKLIIIGDGPESEIVKNAASVNNNIFYLGRIIEGVDKYFAGSDCFVLPGAGGLALNQALFWEKPCIASFADGTEEDLVLEGETGFRFIRNNVISLKNSMNNILALSQEKRELMGLKGNAIIVSKSNVNEMVKTFISVLNELNKQTKKV